MKKITLCLMLILALIIVPGAIFAAETSDPKVYSTKGTYTLNLEGEFTASGYDAAIYVHSGAKLTVNGNGKVYAYGDNRGSGDKYATAVWAYGEGSEIEINGGTYTNQDVGDDHVDLIYAKAGGKIVINGGTFNCATPKWTLNLHDSLRGEIIVKGGTFYKFNPADAQTEPGEEHFNYVAPGYGVMKDGDWYTVVKTEYTSGNNTLNLSNDLTGSGYDAAIYVHSGAKLTVNGNGKVYAYGDNRGSGDKYATAVWAYGEGSEIEINGGTYTNQDVGDDHVDLIYAKAGGKIVINGGTFNCATPKWTLNLHDSLRGEIIVKGGTFYKFNPADAQTEPGEEHFNYVAPGYRVVKNGDWYTVYEEHTITVKQTEGGTVTADKTKAIAEEEVTLKVEVKDGYRLDKIEVYDEGMGTTLKDERTFKMLWGDTTIEPKFSKLTTEAEVSKDVKDAEKVEEILLETLKENEDLAEAIEGKNVEVKVEVKEKEITASEKTDIEEAVTEKDANLKVYSYLDIAIVVKDADNGDKLGNLPTVKNAITFTVAIPEDLPEVEEGYERIFYIVRNHNGKIELLNAEEVDGKLEFQSDKFSTYAIAYKDVKEETIVTPPTGEGNEGEAEQQPEVKPSTPDVPKTGDNVIVYAVFAVVAMAGMAVTIKMRRK